ncbi:glutamate cyclase domain-containing protein [Chelatococcus sp. GCM10030263]|uniref:glutamate cyclase domain-containing protein n=1 Tax=Chelatococcus sp. GCM10030263 TaxID=3273387 RepID=UPI0036184ED3
MTEIAADNIDRLMNIEMRRRGLPRGKKWPLFQMAREAQGGSLVLAAANALNRPPSKILIATGAAVPDHMPVGENDGPIGSAVLAKALTTLGHTVAIVTDPVCAPPIEGLLRYLDTEAEVVQVGLDDSAKQVALAEAHDVIVAVERLGGNDKGNIHGVNGVPRGAHRANLDLLFRTASQAGKTTVGIGDGGNEIGFGKIHAQMEQQLPEFVFRDVTPCGGGVFSTVATDVLLVASSSNIGCTATVAGLALVTGKPELCHAPELDVELHLVGVGVGLVDGGTGQPRAWCDGIPPASNAAMAELMRNIVERTLEETFLRRF